MIDLLLFTVIFLQAGLGYYCGFLDARDKYKRYRDKHGRFMGKFYDIAN